MGELAVGFDLDLTLVDSRPGIAAAYRELGARTGVDIDTDAVVARLGPPLEVELANWYPVEKVGPMADAFRALYPDYAVVDSPVYAGVAESFDAVRALGRRVVVITGKYAPNARLHLDHLGLVTDALVGFAWGDGKVAAMREHGVGIYVGDHVADMVAARQAGAVAVGVLTGAHVAAELHDAGAHSVLTAIHEFPDWLRDHVLA